MTQMKDLSKSFPSIITFFSCDHFLIGICPLKKSAIFFAPMVISFLLYLVCDETNSKERPIFFLSFYSKEISVLQKNPLKFSWNVWFNQETLASCTAQIKSILFGSIRTPLLLEQIIKCLD